jgi:hypothetical protein
MEGGKKGQTWRSSDEEQSEETSTVLTGTSEGLTQLLANVAFLTLM